MLPCIVCGVPRSIQNRAARPVVGTGVREHI